jgi:DNA-binding response OmpR family regulator
MIQDNLRILLVDDEETYIKVLAAHLKDECGFRTTLAFDGREAVDLIRKSHTGFDIILLDYMMPEMNGLNVLQWMLEQKCEIPVIMLTGAGSEQVAVEALKLGAYDYIRKERVDIAHLSVIIRATHERHLYRISEEEQRERTKEIALNSLATEQVRHVINAITPAFTGALAQLESMLETDLKASLSSLSENDRKELNRVFRAIGQNVQTLEAAMRGILSLFQLLHAHHTESAEIETIRSQMESALKHSQN